MDLEWAVFWPLDLPWTFLSTLVIHVLSRARTRALELLKTCPKYGVQTGFRNLPIGGAFPQRIGRCHAVDLSLTGSVGWEAYDSLLQGCRDAAPNGAASQPQIQERGKDGFDQAAVSECRDLTER